MPGNGCLHQRVSLTTRPDEVLNYDSAIANPAPVTI
jgi:hypothetical protein